MIQTAPLCDKHAGETWPPRCDLCELLAREWRALHPPTATPTTQTSKKRKRRSPKQSTDTQTPHPRRNRKDKP